MQVQFLTVLRLVGLVTAATIASLPAHTETVREKHELQDGVRAACELVPGPRHSVVRVEGGDTLVLDTGRRLRLLGSLAPGRPMAADAGDTWRPQREAEDALRTLVQGKEVSLAFEGRRSDRYGRILAHVFVWHEGRRYWVQGELLANGHARAYALPGNTGCIRELLANESLARNTKRGLWRLAHYRVLRPNPAAWLMRRRHRFEIISGQIADVAVVKGTVYLNFGDNWRQDFTAAIKSKALAGTGTTLDDLTGLKGQTVEVRGWIARRNGPYMQLPHPDLIQVLDAGGPRKPSQEVPELAGQSSEPEWPAVGRPERRNRRIEPRIKKRPQAPSPADALKL